MLRRVAACLQASHRQRDRRASLRQAQLLLILMDHAELTTQQLMPLLGLGQGGTFRHAQTLARYGLLSFTDRSGKRHHRLSRSAEDSLLRLVVGPKVVVST